MWFLMLATVTWATDVELPVETRLLDSLGAPILSTIPMTASLCPNAVPTGGEVCVTQSLGTVTPQNGYLSFTFGEGGGLNHHAFDVDRWLSFTVNGTELLPREPVQPPPFADRGMLHLGTASATACSGGQNIGAITYLDGTVKFCDGVGWRTLADSNIVTFSGGRRWSDNTYARSCAEYLSPPPGYRYDGATGDGVYTIDPDGSLPINVQCDMSDGGWTLWANNNFESSTPSGWTDNSTFVCSGDTMHGGYSNVAWSPNGSVSRTFDLRTLPHTEAKMEGTIWFVDSWDTETATLTFDGSTAYSRTYIYSGTGSSNCGNGTYNDFSDTFSGSTSHTAGSILVNWSNNLDGNGDGATNESLGIGDYELWVR